MIGATAISGARRSEAAPVFLPDAAVEVALTLPEPAVAVPELWVPAFCEPAPVKPTPAPAPCFMNLAAGAGRAGRASLVTFHVDD